jgi:cytochrome c oxidase assembly protein subunit 15
MIGCWVIALVGFVGWLEPRKWVKGLTVALLCGVIIQGILGGFRVWLDERGLAMMHGFFAACVTACLATTVTVLSKRWFTVEEDCRSAQVGHLKPFAIVTLVLITSQYLLGGMIRHHGLGLHEHLGLGILTGVCVLANAIASHLSGIKWIRQMGWGTLAVVLLQIGLGAGAWISRWGYAPTGYVATADSVHQVAIRTAHMVTGIIVFASAVVHTLRVFRVSFISDYVEPELVLTAAVPTSGGAA